MAVLAAFGFVRTIQPLLTYMLSGLAEIQSGSKRVGFYHSELKKKESFTHRKT